MQVSLIVTTYNWPRALDLTLASVARQSRPPDEVIVADDGSGVDTAQVIEQWRTRLPCNLMHSWQEDSGFRVARSRNLAIARARGDYLVLIDGDMILHRQFIHDHIRCARPDCFIQGARPRLSERITQQLLSGEQVRLNASTPDLEHRSYALRSTLLSRWASRIKTSLGGIQGCNQSFWREHVLRVNGYDERFDAWGPEDREFAARLLHIGVRRNYVRHRAIAFHLFHRSRAPTGNNPLDDLLTQTLAARSTWCKNGLDAHLPPAA